MNAPPLRTLKQGYVSGPTVAFSSPGIPGEVAMGIHWNRLNSYGNCLDGPSLRRHRWLLYGGGLRGDFRGGLVFKARRLVVSLNSRPRVMKKKKKAAGYGGTLGRFRAASPLPHSRNGPKVWNLIRLHPAYAPTTSPDVDYPIDGYSKIPMKP